MPAASERKPRQQRKSKQSTRTTPPVIKKSSFQPPKPRITTDGSTTFVHHTSSKKMPGKMIFTLVLFFLCLVIGVAPHAYVTTIQREIRLTRASIQTYRESNRILRAQINERYTLDEIERIATDRLGMAPPEPAQIIYINVPRQAQVFLNPELPQVQQNYFWQDVLNFFNRVMRR